jgi:5-methylcytosine-specific restriction endonuclease McrA
VCQVVKPIENFGPHKKNPSGYQYECRQCVNAKVKRYMAEKGNEYKEKKRAYDKERVSKIKDKLSEQGRVRYEKNRATRIAYSKEWCEKNPEKSSAIKQHYKHKRRAQESVGASYSEVLTWRKAQPKVCHWCGCDCSADVIVDHYFPLSKGGKHEISNMVISCRSCNARKSAKTPERWIAERQVSAITYSDKYGQVARNTVTPEMLE